mmetsp:Transcript_3866/g.5859  ORF Transcript_3866/g.5859 Transcript_3866/m.5859 type:complete len:126 (-) Transcript_3866:344-721(-)
MQQINGMQVQDSTPGLMNGTKTLNVRRTGSYANQSLEGSGMMSGAGLLNPNQRLPSASMISTDPVNEIDQFNKKLMEDNIADLILNLNSLQHNLPNIETFLQLSVQNKRLAEDIAKNNAATKEYL